MSGALRFGELVIDYVIASKIEALDERATGPLLNGYNPAQLSPVAEGIKINFFRCAGWRDDHPSLSMLTAHDIEVDYFKRHTMTGEHWG